eukprot:gnl/TRDRNA2_/TRDRNA2_177328_c3_seq1.p1 gnl/TRDRNA2_/TRDRNA2_177328_c3~~gnl/TRDRNA2_/TRDRNA2_177328_c3_seq1.p1  ORF type:complete len:522 (-),score=51.67 gnl/TRDRNA2_/TRDRNA2_177328_c3_seq1:109-1485(-)
MADADKDDPPPVRNLSEVSREDMVAYLRNAELPPHALLLNSAFEAMWTNFDYEPGTDCNRVQQRGGSYRGEGHVSPNAKVHGAQRQVDSAAAPVSHPMRKGGKDQDRSCYASTRAPESVLCSISSSSPGERGGVLQWKSANPQPDEYYIGSLTGISSNSGAVPALNRHTMLNVEEHYSWPPSQDVPHRTANHVRAHRPQGPALIRHQKTTAHGGETRLPQWQSAPGSFKNSSTPVPISESALRFLQSLVDPAGHPGPMVWPYRQHQPQQAISKSPLPSELPLPSLNSNQHTDTRTDASISPDYEDLSDVESDCDLDEDDDVEVVVGPKLAVVGGSLQDYALPDAKRANAVVPIVSNSRILAVSECLRLSKARGITCPLSFGSVQHFCNPLHRNCRPCMYERWAGRCVRKWLCDFCHLLIHVGPPKEQTASGKEGKKGASAKGAKAAKMRILSKKGLSM